MGRAGAQGSTAWSDNYPSARGRPSPRGVITLSTQRPSSSDTVREAIEPGRLLAHIQDALHARPGTGRSGWSSGAHLHRDVERSLGRTVGARPFEAALAKLVQRRLARSWADEQGHLWYCPTGVGSTTLSPRHPGSGASWS